MNAYDDTLMWTRAYLQWLDGDGEQRKTDVFRAAIAQITTRTEGDCRRIDEALRVLDALRTCDRRASRAPVVTDGWEQALDAVAADLHALEGKVLALKSGARGLS